MTTGRTVPVAVMTIMSITITIMMSIVMARMSTNIITMSMVMVSMNTITMNMVMADMNMTTIMMSTGIAITMRTKFSHPGGWSRLRFTAGRRLAIFWRSWTGMKCMVWFCGPKEWCLRRMAAGSILTMYRRKAVSEAGSLT